MLLAMSSCPFCDNGHSTPCFATYDDGYKCYRCGKSKSRDSVYTAYIPYTKEPKKTWNIPEHTNDPNKFSIDVLQWLYKYYIFNDIIKKFRIGYIPDSNSLIFPVFKNGEMVFCQLRKFNPKSFLTYGCKETLIIPRLESRQDTRLESLLVIVEDFISAIRIAQYCDVLLLAGTSASYTTLSECARKYDHFIVWLDSDNPGQIASQKLMDRLFAIRELRTRDHAYAYNSFSTIDQRSTELDPKCYTDVEINQILGGS